MKFSKAIAYTLLGLSGSTNAFTVSSKFNNNNVMTSTFANQVGTLPVSKRMSTKSDTAAAVPSTATSSDQEPTSPLLREDFQMAMDQTIKVLKSALENPALESLLEHFIKEYFTACYEANVNGDESITALSTAENMKDALQYGMTYGLKDKYKFGSTHTALRGQNPDEEDGNTIDFYKFGCDFFRPAMNLDKSYVLGEDSLKTISEQLAKGENVVLFANHQSEADPQVMSCLLEKNGFNEEAEKLVYVAGHKVTTDALAIPFSMGRNLICIHSKKHIDADPETKPLKSKQNLMAMSGMLQQLKNGGTCIWVAPSGGRDRRDLETGKVPIAPFDQKTVDMFRLMGNKSKTPTHFYAVSMVSYDLCPPPDFVEAGTGEQRNVRFVPVGINVSEELENVGGVESRHLFTENAFEVCQKGYDELLENMNM
jgi:glycerol-3-phosphate O-acyltransferase